MDFRLNPHLASKARGPAAPESPNTPSRSLAAGNIASWYPAFRVFLRFRVFGSFVWVTRRQSICRDCSLGPICAKGGATGDGPSTRPRLSSDRWRGHRVDTQLGRRSRNCRGGARWARAWGGVEGYENALLCPRNQTGIKSLANRSGQSADSQCRQLAAMGPESGRRNLWGSLGRARCYHTRALPPSGLLGPVRMIPCKHWTISPQA